MVQILKTKNIDNANKNIYIITKYRRKKSEFSFEEKLSWAFTCAV